MTAASTAILLFSRSAAAESRAKALGRSERVAGAFIQCTERVLARSGLPVLRSDETDQRGSEFGSRLAAAVQRVFERGFERVIVVGNDCASLRTSHLRAAANLLERGRNVLGPDHRGGAWLIGLQRANFDARAFAELRWETADTYTDLAALLPEARTLGWLHDLNRLADLRRLWHLLRNRFSKLYELLFGPTPALAGKGVMPGAVVVIRRKGRGPPSA